MKRQLGKGLLVVSMLTLLLVGCAGGQDAPTQSGGINAAIETKPQKPVANKDTEFRVSVTEPDRDVAVEKAQVTLFLEMKEMDHGANQVELTEVEPGVYQGKGKFPMAGIWVAHIRAKQDKQTRTNNVELKVQ